jgi:hypothetical protein
VCRVALMTRSQAPRIRSYTLIVVRNFKLCFARHVGCATKLGYPVRHESYETSSFTACGNLSTILNERDCLHS